MSNIFLSVAEDDPAHILVIQGTLKSLFPEIKFFLAKNGKELLISIHTIAPDLLITDINMPEINGLELTEIIRRDRSYDYLPIVIFSSSDRESVRIEASLKGADAYYVKPSEEKYGEVIGNAIKGPYPQRSYFQKPKVLPPLIGKSESVKKNSNWANINAMMEDL
jgi:CheY-like chemotaxis protein